MYKSHPCPWLCCSLDGGVIGGVNNDFIESLFLSQLELVVTIPQSCNLSQSCEKLLQPLLCTTSCLP